MESIAIGWAEDNERHVGDFVTKINNCRRGIAKQQKNSPPYKKEKINDLQKAFEELQSDNNRTHEEI